MKFILKTKTKEKERFKCYRCGYISLKKLKYCPECEKEGFNIQMIKILDD